MEKRLEVIALDVKDDDMLLGIVHDMLNNEASSLHWHVEKSSDQQQQWLRCTCESAYLPAQGWKLHISATVYSAQAVLRRVLPVLFASTTNFKIAASLQKLLFLNRGYGGNSQIGKFITVYPKDDDEAVRLAIALDKATEGLSGPNVPSDRVLHPGSLVHYRYGGIGNALKIQTQLGLILPAIQSPANGLVPDQRSVQYKMPDWVTDPFVAAGVAQEPLPAAHIIGKRYLIIATISASLSHIIQLAADMEQGRSCVIKGPGYAWLNNTTDTLCNEGLRHEADVLATLAPNPYIPTFFDLCEQDGNCYLVMEDLEGELLYNHINKINSLGKLLPLTKVVQWGKELATILATIHAQGFVYADLKPLNVIVGKDEHLRLIDFELAHRQEHSSFTGRGTRGYMSPQQCDDQPATTSDDVYSFGALLYFMVTQAEPSLSLHPLHLLERPLELLRPGIGSQLRDIIVRCLQDQPEQRYASMEELRLALEAAEAGVLSFTVPFGEEAMSALATSASCRELARGLLDTLCVEAQPASPQQGLVWTSHHQQSYGLKARDINTGNAGVVLALAELVEEFAEADAYSVLREGAQWLCSSSALGLQKLPGLYVGESGVGAALLRAGQVLHDEHLLASALQQGRLVASMPYASPDMLQGTAGRLRFHLLLWDETSDDAQLQAAIACGEQLLATVESVNGQGAFWTIPEGYDGLSGHVYLGYAHGAAGIADALLDLFEATLDERFLPLIQKVGRWLMKQVMRGVEDESIVSWPRTVGGAPTLPFWCHGGTGIGRFFLHAALCDALADALDMAVCAAMTMARSTRWAAPTQCHGLAGNIEFLLDLYQATQDRMYLSEALALGSLLATFATERDGHLVFPSEEPTIFTPDYTVGYAGVAMSFLRLSAPERLPHQLSRAGFRTHMLKRVTV